MIRFVHWCGHLNLMLSKQKSSRFEKKNRNINYYLQDPWLTIMHIPFCLCFLFLMTAVYGLFV